MSLVVGGGAQVASHLMKAHGITVAPRWVTVVVSCVPVAVLGHTTGLATLVRHDTTSPDRNHQPSPLRRSPSTIKTDTQTHTDTHTDADRHLSGRAGRSTHLWWTRLTGRLRHADDIPDARPAERYARPAVRHLLLLARGLEGYRRMCRVISNAHLRGGERGRPIYDLDEVVDELRGHVVALSGAGGTWCSPPRPLTLNQSTTG